MAMADVVEGVINRKPVQPRQLFSPLMEENLIQTVVLLLGQLNQGYLGHLCSREKGHEHN